MKTYQELLTYIGFVTLQRYKLSKSLVPYTNWISQCHDLKKKTMLLWEIGTTQDTADQTKKNPRQISNLGEAISSPRMAPKSPRMAPKSLIMAPK